jgi:hypothetical protein
MVCTEPVQRLHTKALQMSDDNWARTCSNVGDVVDCNVVDDHSSVCALAARVLRKQPSFD